MPCGVGRHVDENLSLLETFLGKVKTGTEGKKYDQLVTFWKN